MNPAYWQRQEPDKPLFPELEWSRPENKALAGKLLIIGGNLHGFAAPAEAYLQAQKAGIGAARVLLPDALKKVLGHVLEYGDFAPSTAASGSFNQQALNEWLLHAAWADGVLLAGDLGRNSETAIVLERFLQKYPGPVTLTKDAATFAANAPANVLARPDTLLVLSLSQLQRLAMHAKMAAAVTFGMDMLRLVDWLHEFTTRFAPHIIVKHHQCMFVAANGQVSTTALPAETPIWRLATATTASVWWLQNPAKPFEALTTAVLAA